MFSTQKGQKTSGHSAMGYAHPKQRGAKHSPRSQSQSSSDNCVCDYHFLQMVFHHVLLCSFCLHVFFVCMSLSVIFMVIVVDTSKTVLLLHLSFANTTEESFGNGQHGSCGLSCGFSWTTMTMEGYINGSPNY